MAKHNKYTDLARLMKAILIREGLTDDEATDALLKVANELRSSPTNEERETADDLRPTFAHRLAHFIACKRSGHAANPVKLAKLEEHYYTHIMHILDGLGAAAIIGGVEWLNSKSAKLVKSTIQSMELDLQNELKLIEKSAQPHLDAPFELGKAVTWRQLREWIEHLTPEQRRRQATIAGRKIKGIGRLADGQPYLIIED